MTDNHKVFPHNQEKEKKKKPRNSRCVLYFPEIVSIFVYLIVCAYLFQICFRLQTKLQNLYISKYF